MPKKITFTTPVDVPIPTDTPPTAASPTGKVLRRIIETDEDGNTTISTEIGMFNASNQVIGYRRGKWKEALPASWQDELDALDALILGDLGEPGTVADDT